MKCIHMLLTMILLTGVIYPVMAQSTVPVHFQVVNRNSPTLYVQGAVLTLSYTNGGQVVWQGTTDANGYAPSSTAPGVNLQSNTPYTLVINADGTAYQQTIQSEAGGVQVIDISQVATFQPLQTIDSSILFYGLLVLGFILLVLGVLSAMKPRKKRKPRTAKAWHFDFG